jgi:hypothetical protein
MENLTYLKQLAGIALDGVVSARREIDSKVLRLPLQSSLWAPAAIGGVIGMLGGSMTGNRKPSSRTAVGGLVGTIVGFGAGLAWASAPALRPIVRTSGRRMTAIRDARWLATHPIDYA